MKIVSNANMRVGLLYGPQVTLEAGVPQEVEDPALAARCLEIGCEEAGKSKLKHTPKVEVATPDIPVEQAMQMLIDAGDESAFDVHGRPRLSDLKEIMGVKITAEERNEVWDSMIPASVDQTNGDSE